MIYSKLFGLVARVVSFFTPIKENLWIFGSDYGNSFREGSKYLLEYMINKHPEVDCCFITQSQEVYRTLQKQGLPVELNTSWKGIIKVSQAKCVFTTQYTNDILFTYKKKGRRFYYLVHGQPFKKSIFSLKETAFGKKISVKRNFLTAIIHKLSHYFSIGYEIQDVEFVSATSEFLQPLMEKDFGGYVPVKILGMPRNDALFQPHRFENEKWLENIDDKFIITYMPTHRAYGQGRVSPTPFQNRLEIQTWLREHNVILVVKNHPNMLKQCKSFYNSDCIIDITDKEIDPQVALYHSDVLVTDFSSVWMDYLLLRRPIFFYIYDNFEQDDAGCHYDIREDPPGHFCYSEDELFRLIQKAKNSYDQMTPKDEIIKKYHLYTDGCSCERYYQEIIAQTL